MAILDSLEDLNTGDVRPDNLHGVDDLVILELPHRLGTLLAVLLGRLQANELVALLRHHGAHLPAVWSRLVELLAQLELELHRLEGSRRPDGPLSVRLRDLEGSWHLPS